MSWLLRSFPESISWRWASSTQASLQASSCSRPLLCHFSKVAHGAADGVMCRVVGSVKNILLKDSEVAFKLPARILLCPSQSEWAACAFQVTLTFLSCPRFLFFSFFFFFSFLFLSFLFFSFFFFSFLLTFSFFFASGSFQPVALLQSFVFAESAARVCSFF